MLRKWLKRAFVFLVCYSILTSLPPIRYIGVICTYALPSSVSIKGTSVNVRSGPGTSYSILGTVPLGFKLSPTDLLSDTSGNGKSWYRFRYNNQNAYIRSDFTKEMSTYVYDASFEADLNMKGFPESYKEGLRDLHANYPNWIFTLHKTGLDFNYVLDNELIGTRTLVNATSISSYKSTEVGKYDFTTSTWPTFDGGAWVAASRAVTAAYLDPRNFLYTPYVFQFEHQTFNSNIHTVAGIKEMVKGTFLDSNIEISGIVSQTVENNILPPFGDVVPFAPSNDSNIIYPGNEVTPFDPNVPVVPILMNLESDNKIYGFSNTYYPNGVNAIESLGPAAGLNINNSNVYDGQSQIIDNTNNVTSEATSFPFIYLPKGSYSYADVIYDACRQVNVNPYVIVSMILQEQGKNGSDSVSGKNSKFKGYYNYGNINAFAGGGYTAIENGLKYASTEGSYNRPWNSKEKGIYGLCDFYANSYVKGGQDTFYLKKWNVQGDNIFKHQYMTNVAGAAAEGQILGNAYDDIMLNMPHEFKIPYYENMSDTRYEMPTGDGSPNNKLKNLFVTNYYLTPTFNPDVSDYSIIVDSNVDQVLINAESYDSRAAVGGIGYIPTTTSYTTAIIYCVAQNKDIRQYNIHIYKKGAENVQAQNITPNPSSITFQSNDIVGTNMSQSAIIIPGNNINNNNISNNGLAGQFNSIGTDRVQIGVAPGQ